ncbi:phospholipase-like protein [Tanacetum coccineum]
MRTVNVVAIHRTDHLKKKKQYSDYYPTYNLYGFAWAFKELNPNLELYATPIEKQTEWFIASIKFIKGLVYEDFNVFQDDGVEGGVTNLESNKDKQPTLADVYDEVRAFKKEVALVKFDDARISKLKRLLNDNFMFRNDISPNGNHNAVNQGLYGPANHPMSTCSRPDIDNAEVAGHVIGIHNADGKNDSPNGNQNGSTCSGADILDGEVADALIGIHKADGNNDSPNVNHNVVNKGLSCSANDPMSTCSSPNMDNGEVTVAGMGIHKADGQNDIPNANDNTVNQGICGSANDPMSTCSSPDMDNGEVSVAVACDGIIIDKADGNNDYTYSQREPSTLDVLVQGFDSQKNHPGIDVIQHDTHVDCSVAKLNDHPTMDIGFTAVPVYDFTNDYIDVLNDEETMPNYSLDDMKLEDEEEKWIATPAPVNHQHVDELVDVYEDIITVLQVNVKYVNVVKDNYKPCLAIVFSNVKPKRKKCGIERNPVLRSVKERKKRLAMSMDSLFGQQATTTPASPKTISRSVNGDLFAPPEFLEDVSGEPKIRSINELMTLEVFVEQLSRPHNCIMDKVTLSDGCSDFIKIQDPLKYRFPWGYRDIVVDREFWLVLACLDNIKQGWLKDYVYFPVCRNRRPWWRTMKRTLPQQLTLYLHEHGVLQSKGIVVETYENKYMFPKVVRQADDYGDCGVWVCIFLYRLSRNLPLTVDDPLQTELSYHERILQYFWRYKIQAEKTVVLDEGTYQLIM